MARVQDASGNSANLEGIANGMQHRAVTCGTASVEVAPAVASRRYLLLVNDSTSPIWINIGATAVANEGVRINAGGGSYEMSAANGNLSSRAVNGISDAVTKILLVTESD